MSWEGVRRKSNKGTRVRNGAFGQNLNYFDTTNVFKTQKKLI